MRVRWSTILAVLVSSTTLLLLQFCLLAQAHHTEAAAALAAPLRQAPAVTEVDPESAPNDLDTPIVITGSGFVDGATVLLNGTSLDDVEWVSSSAVKATVPWGMDPGVYTLTVTNPGDQSGSLPSAFEVEPGIDVWNEGHLYGGEVNQVVINPVTPTTVYAVSYDVGMFRSQDAGENWTFKVPGGVGGVKDLAIDPLLTNRLYMFAPWSLHRSDDEGDTWISLDTEGEMPYPHPTISGTVYASSQWDGGGLWKSTNRGQTWVTKTNGLTDTEVVALAFHPTDPLTMVVGTQNGNLFRTTNGGDLWAHASQPVQCVQDLAFNPFGGHELWASDCCFSESPTTFKSTNSDYTAWTNVADPVGSMPSRYIVFPPVAWGNTYTETVYASDCWASAYKSTDSGDSWDTFGPEAGSVDITLHPTDPDIIYTSSFWEGVYNTTDGGTTWRVVDRGITAFFPDQMATVPDRPDVVYGTALRPGGIFKATRGGETWHFLQITETGHFESVLADPFTSTRVYAAGAGAGGPGVQVHISSDEGQTWPTYSDLAAPAQYSDYVHSEPVLKADPSLPGTLLAAVRHMRFGVPGFNAGSIYRSTNYGDHWTLIDVGHEISPVIDMAFDREVTSMVYAATGAWDEGSGIWRSADSGQNWERVGASLPALDYVDSLTVEPGPPYRVFTWRQSGDESVRGLYVSENHGVSWAKADASPDWLFVNQILCTEDRPSLLYAASNDGLYRSRDGAQTWDGWERASGSLGRIPVYSLAQVATDDRVVVYAGTTGGYVENVSIEAHALAGTSGTLVRAGVYRYTTRSNPRFHFPLALKRYAQ